MAKIFNAALFIVTTCFSHVTHARQLTDGTRSSTVSTNEIISLIGTNLSNVALAVVEGKPLTVSEVKEAVIVYHKAAELSTGRSLPAPGGRRANELAMRLTPQLVSAMILEAELNRKGIKSTPQSDAAVLLSYNKRFKKNIKNSEELCSLFGEFSEAFRKQFKRESRYKAFFSSEKSLVVTDSDIDRFYKNITNRLNRTERINKRATKTLHKALAELKSGVAWDVVATNYTEDALLDKSLHDNWQDWISIDLNKIQPMDLMVAVSKLKPGEYTRPIETDEGLVIVKLTNRDGDFCSLARILVRMGVKVVVPDRESALKKIRRDKYHRFQRELLPSLKEKVKVDYPFGKKFKFIIWDETPDKGVTKKVK